MRSRYTAFVLRRHDHLARTLHPDHEDRALPARVLRERLEKHGVRARYHGLEILDREGPDATGVWRVLFRVSMKIAGADASFAELSSFAHDGVGLRYLAGETVDLRTTGRTGRQTIRAIDRAQGR